MSQLLKTRIGGVADTGRRAVTVGVNSSLRTVSISNLAVMISFRVEADGRPMALRRRLSAGLPLLIDSSYGFIIERPEYSVHMIFVLYFEIFRD